MLNPDAIGGYQYDLIDALQYIYDSSPNKVSTIIDSKEPELGFKGGTGNYGYDPTGNMITLSNKALGMEYAFNDLPVLMSTPNGQIINYYTSTGLKLKSVLISSTVQDEGHITNYFENFEYVNSKLKSVYFEEGRASYDEDATEPEDQKYIEYFLKDHLGNTRVRIADKNVDNKVKFNVNKPGDDELMSTHHYYPFGMEWDTPNFDGNGNSLTGSGDKTKYTYNGKEYLDDLDIDLSDYGARYYDPSIARFTSVDRFADNFPSQSPYTYASNNPIRFIDINGDSTYLVVYGSGWYRPENQGETYDVGGAFKKSAEVRAEQIRNGAGFDSERDAVVLVYAATEDEFFNVTNSEYDSGEIASLDVYSHGTGNSISLGGESSDKNSQEDKRWVSVYDTSADSNSPGENEFLKINSSNFSSSARCTLWGCNQGGINSSNSSRSPAQSLVNQVGGTTRAFIGGGGAEFKQKGGRNIYDGTLIRSADRASQKTRLSKFKRGG